MVVSKVKWLMPKLLLKLNMILVMLILENLLVVLPKPLLIWPNSKAFLLSTQPLLLPEEKSSLTELLKLMPDKLCLILLVPKEKLNLKDITILETNIILSLPLLMIAEQLLLLD